MMAGGTSSRRWSAARRRLRGFAAAVAVALAATAALATPRAAVAFNDQSYVLPSLRLYYVVQPSFTTYGFQVPVLYDSEHTWKVQDLTLSAELWNDQNLGASPQPRQIVAIGIDGAGGWSALSTTPCADNSSNCIMRFDTAEHWNTLNTATQPGWLDFRSVATHEFGHWLGLNHSSDLPASDGGSRLPTNVDANPAMWDSVGLGVSRRAIRQDDANGLKTARRGAGSYTNMIANPSFEHNVASGSDPFASKFDGWLFLPQNGGQQARYPQGGYEGSWWAEFNGYGSSMAQDVYSYIAGGSWQGSHEMQGSFRVRNPTGTPQLVEVVVWALSTGAKWTRQESIPANSGWVLVPTSRFWQPSASTPLRLQIYNYGGNNIRIDSAKIQVF